MQGFNWFFPIMVFWGLLLIADGHLSPFCRTMTVSYLQWPSNRHHWIAIFPFFWNKQMPTWIGHRIVPTPTSHDSSSWIAYFNMFLLIFSFKSVQFQFFDTIELTNLTNGRYCIACICSYPKYILQTATLQPQLFFKF